MDIKAHWETIYKTKQPHEVSWFQREATISLALIRRVAPQPTSAIIDIGGGASTLVDGPIAAGYRNISVLDLSSAAVAQARGRLGPAAADVKWLEADIRSSAVNSDLWKAFAKNIERHQASRRRLSIACAEFSQTH